MLKRAIKHLKIGEDGEVHDENQYTCLISELRSPLDFSYVNSVVRADENRV